MIADVALLLLLAGGFVLGFYRGLVRQMVALGAWLVVFLGSVYLRLPVGDWLGRSSSQFSFDYAQMLAFTALYVALFIGAVTLIEFGGAGSSLTKYPLLDDALGGLAGLLLAVLVAAGLLVALDSYYVAHPTILPGELIWLRQLHADLSDSALAGPLHDWVIRPLGTLLSPILPADIRVAMS